MEYKINDIITEIAMGPFGSNIKKECFIDTGFPVLNGSNLSGIKLNENSFNYVSNEKAFELRKAIAKRGDIVITHRGTLGQIVYIQNNSKYDEYLISQSQFRIRCNKQIVLPEYLVYFFHTRLGQYKLTANKSQVGVPSLAQPTTYFRKVKINLPSLKVQENICNILGSIDSKIELNNKINNNLQSISQLLFKQWFVDFDFLNEEGLPYKSSGGEMVDSELGMIPKGWEVSALCTIADIVMGQSPSGTSYNEDSNGAVFYQGRTDFGERFPIQRLYTTEPKRMAKLGETLMSVRAPVGDINIAYEDCCIGRGLCSIKSKNNYNSYIYYVMLNLKDKLNVYNGEGTVFGSINKDTLANLNIVKPMDSIIEMFNKIACNLDQQYLCLVKENRELLQTRNILLPKLMNGEIDLSNLEINL